MMEAEFRDRERFEDVHLLTLKTEEAQARSYTQPLESQHDFLLEVPGGTRPANTLTSAQRDRLWTSHLQNHKIINLCYLMLLNLWSFIIAAVGN